MSEKWSELRISNDFLFGKVMRNQTVCKKLIELILDIQIDHIEYPENQKVIDLTISTPAPLAMRCFLDGFRISGLDRSFGLSRMWLRTPHSAKDIL